MPTGKRRQVAVQYACTGEQDDLPDQARVRSWARAAFATGQRCGSITVRFVDADESQRLNRNYRGKGYATNVLSFPYESAPLVCGDLVVCAPVVAREAVEQGKALVAHYAHLIVHGMLHLQGFDHEADEEQAMAMESKERRILAALGYPDPYREGRYGQ